MLLCHACFTSWMILTRFVRQDTKCNLGISFKKSVDPVGHEEKDVIKIKLGKLNATWRSSL